MSKPFAYWIRLATVVTLCTLVTFNPAHAGRWIDRFLNRSCTNPTPCAPVQSGSCDCPTVTAAASCTPCPPSTKVGCDELPTTEQSQATLNADPIANDSGIVHSGLSPAEESAIIGDVEMAPIHSEESGIPSLFIPDTQVVAPADAVPVDEQLVPDVMIEKDAAPVEIEAKPAQDPLDDLFGDGDKPGAANDVKKPVEPAVMEDGLDDLFGDNKPADPVADEPAMEEADPKAKNDNALDDLFADPPKNDDAAKEEANLDDIFGKPIKAGNGIDFDNKNEIIPSELTDPKPEPATNDKKNDRFLEDLFKSSDPNQNEGPTNGIKNNKENKKVEDELDRLFRSNTFVAPDSFHGAEFRSWKDNTGAYEIKARVAVIFSDRVRLLKDNGKHTTVPFSRLSPADQSYVQWVADNLTQTHAKLVKKDESAIPSNELAR